MTRSLARLPLVLLLTPCALADDPLWIVDAAGGGDFLEIAEALPVAAQDAAILIRPGVYEEPVTLLNHGITLIADGEGPVILTQPLTVTQLGVTRDAFVSGIELRGGFEVTSNQGLVRFEDCVVPQPQDADFPLDLMYFEFDDCGVGRSTQVVDDCRGVSFVNCSFHGADGLDGIPGTTGDAAPAHHGLWVRDADVSIYACTLVGGEGGAAIAPGNFPVSSGAGGDGLRLVGNSNARICSLNAQGGLGGTFQPGGNGSFGVTFGCDGISIRADLESQAVDCSHPDILLEVPGVWEANEAVTLRVTGPPASGVFLIYAGAPDYRVLPPSLGILHLMTPLSIESLGNIPANGVLEVSTMGAGPGAGDRFENLQLQAFGTQLGSRFLSNPRRSIVVAPGL